MMGVTEASTSAAALTSFPVRNTSTSGNPEVPSAPTPMDSTSKACETVISPVRKDARRTPSAVTATVCPS